MEERTHATEKRTIFPSLNTSFFSDLYGKRPSIPVGKQLGVALGILFTVFGVTYTSTIFALHERVPDANETRVEAQVVTAKQVTSNALNPFSSTTIEARAAYVWDVRSGKILFNKNGDEALPIASVTKLMTALVAYELLSATDTVKISEEALNVEGDDGLLLGETFSSQNISDLMLIASSNDGATALALAAGRSIGGSGDPLELFIRAMNVRATELGLTNTKYSNVTGLDLDTVRAGAKGSARDMATLMEYILKNYPEMVSLTKMSSVRILNKSGEYHLVNNTNEIVGEIPSLIASKTGYTDLAGGNLVVAFDAGFNHPVVVSVLGSSFEGRFSDVLTLVTKARASILEETN